MTCSSSQRSYHKSVLSGLVGAALLVAGCTASAGPPPTAAPVGGSCPTTPAKIGDPVTVTFWEYLNQHDEGVLIRMVDDFNGSQSAIHVSLDRHAGVSDATGVYPTPAQVAGRFFRASQDHRSVPDIVELPEFATRAGIDSGALTPVQTCVDPSQTTLSGFVPAALAQTRLGGTQWGLPLALYGWLQAYNAQAFDHAGLDPSRPPTDLASLVADAHVLQAHGVATPVAGFAVDDVLRLSGVVYTDHNDGQTGTPTRSALDTPTTRAVLDAARELLGAHELLIPPSGAPTPDHPAACAVCGEMAEGRVAIIGLGIGELYRALPAIAQGQAPNVTLGVGPIPSLHGPGGAEITSNNLFLAKASPPARRAAAWRFLSWLEQPAQQVRLATAIGSFPDQTAAVTDPTFAGLLDQYPTLRKAWDLLTSGPSVVPDLIGPWRPIQNGTLPGIQQALADGATVDTAIRNADASINMWLTKYNGDMVMYDRCFGGGDGAPECPG